MSDSLVFSVIVPTRDRPSSLQRCLDSLVAQDFPRDRFEIIVVDDGSRRSPAPLLEAYAEHDVTLLQQKNTGPAAARNAGAARARGCYLAFTDDDCSPATGWLSALEHAVLNAPGHMIGGLTHNRVERNAYSEVSQALVSYLYEYYNDSEDVRFLTSNNIAVPAQSFHQLGGFSARFPRAAAEDRDFCERWTRAGLSMTYAPEAIVDHHHVLDLPGFWRQHFNYGRGAHGFHRARAARGSGPLKVEPPRFYLGLVGYPLARDRSARAFYCAALMALTQLANAAGFFYEAMSARWLVAGPQAGGGRDTRAG